MPEALHSVAVGADTTLFYRSTPSGFEGFVVDDIELVETLEQRVLDEPELADVIEVVPLGASAPEAGALAHSQHLHRFAEPFSSIEAEMRLAPLEPPATEQLLLPIIVGLGVFILLGLFALHRMVVARVELSQRQANFVSAVSHELKTPLTAIRMHGEMLRDGLVPSQEKMSESYRTITAQAERLSRLIGNVLVLSKVEKAPLALPARGSLLPPLRSCVEALRPHVTEAGFALAYEAPEKTPAVPLDPDAVEQILFNLIDNALKYAAAAQDRRITVSVETSEDSVQLSVRDRGPGLAESELRKVFEPFYRTGDELTRDKPGTGLGLALVRDLAGQMGAQVHAQRAEPGLRVVVSFPRSAESVTR